jgi:hypothetical protein
MKIHPVRAELFHADGRTDGRKQTERWTDSQTDMTKLIIAFRNFRTRLKFRILGSNMVVHMVITGLQKSEDYHAAWNARISNFLFTIYDILYNTLIYQNTKEKPIQDRIVPTTMTWFSHYNDTSQRKYLHSTSGKFPQFSKNFRADKIPGHSRNYVFVRALNICR